MKKYYKRKVIVGQVFTSDYLLKERTAVKLVLAKQWMILCYVDLSQSIVQGPLKPNKVGNNLPCEAQGSSARVRARGQFGPVLTYE